MIIMITRARVSGCLHSRLVAAAVLLASAVTGAAVLGGLVGLAGRALDPATRAGLGVLAIAAVLAGMLLRSEPWQLDRETNQGWLRYLDWRTAAYNGVALGLAVTTRIGFWLFYAVVLAAFVLADPVTGAAGLAIFAVTRVGASLVLSASGVQVAGRGWIAPLRAGTNLLTSAVLGYLAVVVLSS